MTVTDPKNISVDFDRYQKKFPKAEYLVIEDGLIKIYEGHTYHIYNLSKVNSIDYDI